MARLEHQFDGEWKARQLSLTPRACPGTVEGKATLPQLSTTPLPWWLDFTPWGLTYRILNECELHCLASLPSLLRRLHGPAYTHPVCHFQCSSYCGSLILPLFSLIFMSRCTACETRLFIAPVCIRRRLLSMFCKLTCPQGLVTEK